MIDTLILCAKAAGAMIPFGLVAFLAVCLADARALRRDEEAAA